uniref:uncharacterized protein n=1 Tax=Myxine glutinosa TaxID=7769 RepID=UPI00358F1EC8
MENGRFFVTSVLIINVIIFYFHWISPQHKQGYADYFWESVFNLLPNTFRPAQVRHGYWFSRLHEAITRPIISQSCSNGNVVNINTVETCIIFTAVCVICSNITQILHAVQSWHYRRAMQDCDCCDFVRELENISEYHIKEPRLKPTSNDGGIVSGTNPSHFGLANYPDHRTMKHDAHPLVRGANQTKPTSEFQPRSPQGPATQSQKDQPSGSSQSQGTVAFIKMIIQKTLRLVFGLLSLVHESYNRICAKQEKSSLKLIPPGQGFLKHCPSSLPFVDGKTVQVLENNIRENIIEHQGGLPGLVQSPLNDIQLPAQTLIQNCSQTKPTRNVIAKTSPLNFITGETREYLEWHIDDKSNKLLV